MYCDVAYLLRLIYAGLYIKLDQPYRFAVTLV